MKTFFAALVLAAACAAPARAQDGHQHAPPKQETAATTEIIKRGAGVGDSPRVKFADVLKEPGKYAGKAVVIEGVVVRVCKKEGCWMEIAPAAGQETVRVTFKDHGFFVPKDGDNLKFRAEGEFTVKTLSKEEVEHLVKDDGAKVKTNPDGTANEITFVATGVELWK